MADLLTLADYKALFGIQAGNTRDDAQISALLPSASRAVRSFTGRNFEVNTGTATVRTFQYDESGMLDIDDCIAVTSVATDAGVAGQTFTLQTTEWTAMPQDDSEVFYYLLVTGGPYYGVSPEMGFNYNLDTIGVSAKQPMVSVTASWGWPVIPEDVKLATALTVSSLLSATQRNSEDLSAEAIAGFARSWGRGGATTVGLTVPNRARDLLVNYQRIFV